MNKLLLKTIFLVFLFSCTKDESSPLEEFVTGAKIAGVNGIHFGPDGMLYAASVIGSDISVINTETGEIIGTTTSDISIDEVSLNDDESVIEGNYCGLEYQIKNNEAVARTKPITDLIRQIRNDLLFASDWTQVNDSPLSDSKKQEWATYRQSLRDLPSTNQSVNNIDDVIFPNQPL